MPARRWTLDHALHRPTARVGDPDRREMDDSPDDPGVANAWSLGRKALGANPAAAPKHRNFIVIVLALCSLTREGRWWLHVWWRAGAGSWPPPIARI